MGKGQFPRPQSQPHLGDLGGTQPWLAGRKGTQAFTHMASAACPTHSGTQRKALPDQHLMLHPDDLSVQSKGLSCIPEFNCHLPKHCMGLFQRKLTGHTLRFLKQSDLQQHRRTWARLAEGAEAQAQIAQGRDNLISLGMNTMADALP